MRVTVKITVTIAMLWLVGAVVTLPFTDQHWWLLAFGYPVMVAGVVGSFGGCAFVLTLLWRDEL